MAECLTLLVSDLPEHEYSSLKECALLYYSLCYNVASNNNIAIFRHHGKFISCYAMHTRCYLYLCVGDL